MLLRGAIAHIDEHGGGYPSEDPGLLRKVDHRGGRSGSQQDIGGDLRHDGVGQAMDQRGRGAELCEDRCDVHNAPFVSANCIRFDEFDLSPLLRGTPASPKVSRDSEKRYGMAISLYRGFTKQFHGIKVYLKYLDDMSLPLVVPSRITLRIKERQKRAA